MHCMYVPLYSSLYLFACEYADVDAGMCVCMFSRARTHPTTHCFSCAPKTTLQTEQTDKMRHDALDTDPDAHPPPQREPPAHSRGGFACVLLDKTYNVAYRLEPMRNQVDAAGVWCV